MSPSQLIVDSMSSLSFSVLPLLSRLVTPSSILRFLYVSGSIDWGLAPAGWESGYYFFSVSSLGLGFAFSETGS